MHVSGETIPRPKAKHQPREPRETSRKPDKANEPKVRFLSTWESPRTGKSSLHRSIHHFCTEPSLPQLPVPLQVVSRQAHANPSESTKKLSAGNEKVKHLRLVIQEGAGDRDLQSSDTCPPPNTPLTTTTVTTGTGASVAKRPASDVYHSSTPPTNTTYAGTSMAKGTAMDEVYHVYSEDKYKSTAKEPGPSTPLPPTSEGRPSTVALKSSVQIDERDDDIVKLAKSKLKREMREVGGSEAAKPSTAAKSSERRVKWREPRQRLVVSRGGDREEMMLVGGARMKVAQDPSRSAVCTHM